MTTTLKGDCLLMQLLKTHNLHPTFPASATVAMGPLLSNQWHGRHDRNRLIAEVAAARAQYDNNRTTQACDNHTGLKC